MGSPRQRIENWKNEKSQFLTETPRKSSLKKHIKVEATMMWTMKWVTLYWMRRHSASKVTLIDENPQYSSHFVVLSPELFTSNRRLHFHKQSLLGSYYHWNSSYKSESESEERFRAIETKYSSIFFSYPSLMKVWQKSRDRISGREFDNPECSGSFSQFCKEYGMKGADVVRIAEGNRSLPILENICGFLSDSSSFCSFLPVRELSIEMCFSLTFELFYKIKFTYLWIYFHQTGEWDCQSTQCHWVRSKTRKFDETLVRYFIWNLSWSPIFRNESRLLS